MVKHTRAPFVASHSNAASVCNVSRNLTDEMIRTLGERGGVAGLNFCAAFLSEENLWDEQGNPKKGPSLSKIEDMVRQMRYMADTGGVEVCALGSDFDGIGDEVEFGDASGMERLAEALHGGRVHHGGD